MDLAKEGWFSRVKILISASQGAFIDSQMDSGEMAHCFMDVGREGWFSSVKILISAGHGGFYGFTDGFWGNDALLHGSRQGRMVF